MTRRLTPAGIASLYAAFAALWIVASGYLLTYTVSDPLLQSRLELGKGLAFVAVTGVLLYLLLSGWRESFGDAIAVQESDVHPPSVTRLVLLFIAMALVVPLIGLAIVKIHTPQTERDTYSNLESIARLKAEQIENWLGERNGDGMTLAASEGFAEQADRLIHDKHDARSLKYVLDRFNELRVAYSYDNILLLDSSGELLASIGERKEVPHALMAGLRLSLESKQVKRGEIFLDESGQAHLDWVVPLVVSGAQGKRAVAAVVLRINLAHFLFPLIQTWPTASDSGETLLVRRDNESVLILNELRHRKEAALIRRLPMTTIDLPAAIALQQDHPGTMQGKDYRGVPVLAAYRPVAGTDWRIVAKIDRDEVMEPVWDMVYWIGLVAFAVTVMILAALLLLWRQQQHAQNLVLLAEKAKADRWMRQFFDLPFIGMAITSPSTKRWLQFNDHLCAILGYSREELIEKTWMELTHPDDLEADIAEFERVMRGEAEGYVMDKRFIRKDGAVVFSTLNTKCVRKSDGTVDYFVKTIQDITARKQAEAALADSEELYRSIVTQAADGIVLVDADTRLIVEFNDAACQSLGYSREEFTGLSIQDIQGEMDAEAVAEKVRLIIEKGVLDFETLHRHKNGSLRDVRVSNRAIQLRGRTYLAGIWADITERKQMAEENYLLLTLGKAIAEAGNFVDALAIAVRLICENAGWDFGEVWIPSPDGTHLELGAPYYCKLESMQGFRSASEKFTFAPGRGLPGRVWLSGKSTWIPDVTVDANFPRAPYAKEFGLRAGVGIPIMTEDSCVAVLEFLMGKAWPVDERKIAIIMAVATQLGTSFQRKLAEERIQHLANFDLLTGLPNRALFAERFNYALGMARRNNQQLALMYIDLDHFKNVNETLGQRIGDALLIKVAERLKAVVRDEDTVSRQGGDEFILMLPDSDVNDATHMAGKLLASIVQHYQIQQYELVVTPSIGIAMYPADGADLEALSKCADTALYRAKADGRNNYRFFTPGMQARSARSLQLENALRRALEREELFLLYQPQVSLQDGHIVGVEALLRWQHPELGMVPPTEFIPVAESSGQILQIGEWVMRTAVRQLKAWMDGGMAPMVMAVNLSAVQFRHASLPELVTQILDEAKLPPQYLELELTEGVAMDDPMEAIAVMDKLHERGIRMSIDDFGTGYSSLSYLKKFKVYKLKIDQSFVRDISEDTEDKAIVSAIINMANSLGMQTISEGVETAAQLAFLRLQGSGEVQGYYFSRPLTAGQFEEFMRGKSGALP